MYQQIQGHDELVSSPDIIARDYMALYPQNNILTSYAYGNARTDKMDIEHEFKQKMHVDVLFDSSMLKVLGAMVAATLILYILCFQSPECRILIYLTWYAGFIVLLLKERTVVELTSHMIIVHRPLFHPLIIDRQNITDVQVKKNTNYPFRWGLYMIALIIAGSLAYDSFYDILSGIHGRTITGEILVILSESIFVFLIIVVFIGMRRKLPHPTVLRIDTDKQYFFFYPKETEEFRKRIEAQDMVQHG
ncbi:hypothetical protein [Methanolobus sp. WCC4]|uniref:hypothetical protein n=1 Tax=Methanolobus sp. WCC4 TaxID=3125784 RepID=UPI0030F83391